MQERGKAWKFHSIVEMADFPLTVAANELDGPEEIPIRTGRLKHNVKR